MDFRELGKRPISDAAPAGAEARQSPEYERLLEETGKLGSLQGAAAVDWNMVVASAADVLEKQAKDIPAAVYLCVGLAHTQGMDGLAAGVRVLADLLACWWDVCFPPLKRLRARTNMLSWWHERMAQWLAAAPAAAVPAALRDDLLASLEELDAQLGDRLPDLPPLRDLKERVQSLDVEAAPVQAAEAEATATTAAETAPSGATAPQEDVPQPVPAPQPAATPASAAPPAPPASPATPPADAQEALAALLAAARAYVALAFAGGLPDTFVAWSALYAVLWGRIDKLPPATDGETALPAPPEEDLDSCRRLLASGRAGDAAAALARLLPACPFCLDAQHLLFQALTACGRPHDAARVREECRALAGRLPGIARLTFAGGRPFADAETRQWLTEQPAAETPPGADTAGEAAADDAVRQARAAAAQGDLPGALDMLDAARRQEGFTSAGAFSLRIEQTRLLLAGGHAQAAAPLADELAGTIKRHALEDWQRDLCVDALRVCHAVWSGLDTPEARQRAAEAAAAIARLRPSRSPYL